MALKQALLVCAGFLAIAACEPKEAETTTPTETASPTETATPEVVEVAPLEAAIASEKRVAPERDEWRNPKETLEFFGVEPGHTVVEIWPGGGWYTSIIGPYLKSGGGKLYAAGFDTESSEYARAGMARFTETFVDHPETYGDIEVTVASKDSEGIAPEGSADVVLTFRNVHNWVSGDFTEKMIADAYKALKPGGVLGVVEHRLPSSVEQDPKASTGYVKEAFVIELAKEAGFQFDGSSEINANPNDTADHPFGVWTLPPNSRSAPRGQQPAPDFDAAKYLAIGESDRMTLKFVKPAAPAEPEAAEEASE